MGWGLGGCQAETWEVGIGGPGRYRVVKYQQPPGGGKGTCGREARTIVLRQGARARMRLPRAGDLEQYGAA